VSFWIALAMVIVTAFWIGLVLAIGVVTVQQLRKLPRPGPRVRDIREHE
jgi:hypothetical protein